MNGKDLISVIFAATVLAPSVYANAQASIKPSTALLSAVTGRGRMLAEYDSAAWQATDAVMSAHPKVEISGRYIARKTLAGWVVDFGRLNGSGDCFLVTHEAVQTSRPSRFEVRNFNAVREDRGWNLAAAKGIETAMRDFGRTDRPYNVAVLSAANGNLYVYLYPAQVKEGVYPVGADVRYRVSPDGTKITEKRQMHKGVIEYGRPGPGDTVSSGYHTHILSDQPEDTDVFLVMVRRPRVPEVISAGAFMYTVGIDGRIAVAKRPK